MVLRGGRGNPWFTDKWRANPGFKRRERQHPWFTEGWRASPISFTRRERLPMVCRRKKNLWHYTGGKQSAGHGKGKTRSIFEGVYGGSAPSGYLNTPLVPHRITQKVSVWVCRKIFQNVARMRQKQGSPSVTL